MEIKKIIRFGFILVAFTWILVSCRKDSGNDDVVNWPVIQGYLVAGKPITIKLYTQKGLLDTSSYGPALSGLSVYVSNGVKEVKLSEDTAGVYTSSDNTLVLENYTCTLRFDYNGKTISAETIVPTKPENFKVSSLNQPVPNPDSAFTNPTDFIPVDFSWSNISNGYYMMQFKNQEESPNRIGNGFGFRRGYEDMEEYLGQVSLFKTQPMTFQFEGRYLVYLYHVNAEYNTILSSSSSSSLNLTNPVTNIKNGLGIFTAMSVDSLPLNVYKDQ
ncbi:DUF4249 family protein [Pedobacter sp. MW01-1-1]|uniref:DUF4249 family protein n=1 Tax=Pedobacter sp. MW01-1-1 TaxID=3383027 RepID=UPI003FEDA9CA